MKASPRRRAVAAAAALAILLGAPSLPVAGAPQDVTCPAPFGTALEVGAHNFVANGSDPDTDIVDTLRMPGAQRSHATVLAFGDRLTLIAEVKVDQGPLFTWGVMVRFYSNDTGWDTAPRWASSVDPSVPFPVGFHVRPSPVIWNGSLWVAWTGEGSLAGGPSDRLVLVRRVSPDGTMDPWMNGSDTDPQRANQHPVLLPAGETLYLAYAAGEGEPEPAATHIAFRAYDGVAFTASENITRPPPGWADELPALAWDGNGTVHAVWSRTNTSGLGALLMHSSRNASGWSPAFEVANVGHATSANPAVVFHEGVLRVAFSTDNPADIVGPDSDVLWRAYDAPSDTWLPSLPVNPQPSGGEDTEPTFSIVGGKLLVGWSTSDDVYARGPDPDPVYSRYENSQLTPPVLLTRSTDNASDGPPRFIELGGVTYAHFTWTPPEFPGQPRGDSREVIRPVNRPTMWFDEAEGIFSITHVSENGSVRVSLTLLHVLPESARLTLRLADGSLFPMDRNAALHVVWAPVDPARPDFEILACGTPITLSVGSIVDLPKPFNWTPIVWALGIAALGAGAYLLARGKPPRAPPPEGGNGAP